MHAATGQQSLKYIKRSMRSWFGFLELYKKRQLDKPNILQQLNKEEYFMISFPKNAFSIKTGNGR